MLPATRERPGVTGRFILPPSTALLGIRRLYIEEGVSGWANAHGVSLSRGAAGCCHQRDICAPCAAFSGASNYFAKSLASRSCVP